MTKKILVFMLIFFVFLASVKGATYLENHSIILDNQAAADDGISCVEIMSENLSYTIEWFETWYNIQWEGCGIYKNQTAVNQLQAGTLTDGIRCDLDVDFDADAGDAYLLCTYGVSTQDTMYSLLTPTPIYDEIIGFYAGTMSDGARTTFAFFPASYMNVVNVSVIYTAPSQNETPNITFNDTGNRTCDYCHYYRNAGDFYELLPILILYIFLILAGYSLIKTGSYLSGLIVFMFSFMVDAILIWLYYDKYVNGMIIDSSVGSIANYVFGFGLLVWVIVKFIVIFSMKVFKRERRF